MRCLYAIWICLALAAFCAHAAFAAESGATASEAPAELQAGAPDAPADLASAGGDAEAELERAAAALAEAEARAADADAAYSRMRRRNHPRGAAREQIVRERAEAWAAVEKARADYDALQGAGGSR